MADGPFERIDRLVPGDVVWASDPETGAEGPREVTHTWVHGDTLVDLVAGDGAVTTTEDHPFWNDTDQEWQRADRLDEGDWLLGPDGQLVVVGGLLEGSTRWGTAYNLTVDDVHTYYVAIDDTPVLVHNTNGCGPSFDEARVEAFDNAFGPGQWEENPDVVPTKWDDETGTAVEFTGPGGSKVGYDGPHPNTPGAFHDQQHISWQSSGRRGTGGSRGNIPYSGPQHPSRPGRVVRYL